MSSCRPLACHVHVNIRFWYFLTIFVTPLKGPWTFYTPGSRAHCISPLPIHMSANWCRFLIFYDFFGYFISDNLRQLIYIPTQIYRCSDWTTTVGKGYSYPRICSLRQFSSYFRMESTSPSILCCLGLKSSFTWLFKPSLKFVVEVHFEKVAYC